MNWENVILTLGIALISSLLPIIGNLINNKQNHKMLIEKNKEESIKEIMNKRIECYKKILICLSFIDENITEVDVIQESNILEHYVDSEIYISEHVYSLLKLLIESFDKQKPEREHYAILNLKLTIKNEINAYLGIPNSIHDKNYPKDKFN